MDVTNFENLKGVPKKNLEQARNWKGIVGMAKWLILANCGRIYDQNWPDLWPNKIVDMAMAIVAIPDITSMVGRQKLNWNQFFNF